MEKTKIIWKLKYRIARIYRATANTSDFDFYRARLFAASKAIAQRHFVIEELKLLGIRLNERDYGGRSV